MDAPHHDRRHHPLSAAVAAVWFGLALAWFAERPRRVPVRLPRPRRAGHRHPGRRRLLVAGAAAAAALPVLPLAAPLAGLGAWAVPVARERRRRRARADELRRDLPEVIDLLGLAVAAGLTVPLAVRVVAARSGAGGPVGRALRQVVAAAEAGRRGADALDAAARDLGPLVRPLFGALAASERYGAPLVDALDRLAAEARADRRRRAEEAARRIPVRLLFPLVLCVLPAFGLLTVAPLLAGALGSLRL